jgi:hypothetical protein
VSEQGRRAVQRGGQCFGRPIGEYLYGGDEFFRETLLAARILDGENTDIRFERRRHGLVAPRTAAGERKADESPSGVE